MGEHPRAADTVGINVYKMRYANVLIGGMIAGLAGAYFTLESVRAFEPVMTNGRGFIALAAMIFGNWSPIGALAAALLFGAAQAFQINLQFYSSISAAGIRLLEEVADRRHAAVPLDDVCADGHCRPHHPARRRWHSVREG